MKRALPWALGYAIIFLLSLDFWNWGRFAPLLMGLPYWVVAFILLNLALSLYYLLFARFYWRD
jgi:hypothetical protein